MSRKPIEGNATSGVEARRKFLKTNLGRALVVTGVLSASKQAALAYPEHANGLRHTNVLVKIPIIGDQHANVAAHVNDAQIIHENFQTHSNGSNHANTTTHANGAGGCADHTNRLVHANVVQGHNNNCTHTNRQ